MRSKVTGAPERRAALGGLPALLAGAGAALLLGAPASGDALQPGPVYRVTETRDGADDRACTQADCTLREALTAARTLSADARAIIELPPETVIVSRIGAGGGGRGASAFVIDRDVRIQGPGATIRRRPDAAPMRVFEVARGGRLTLAGLTLAGGLAPAGEGGGVLVHRGGMLKLEGARVQENAARFGGGLYVAGSASIENTRIERNSGGRGAGAFVSPTGALRAEESWISFNRGAGAGSVGGGVETLGSVSLNKSALFGNEAEDGAALRATASGAVEAWSVSVEANLAGEGSAAVVVDETALLTGLSFVQNAPEACLAIAPGGFARPCLAAPIRGRIGPTLVAAESERPKR